jgi:hypothetical protein
LINQQLHRQPVALDSVQHRNLKLHMPVTDWKVAKDLNAMFVAAAEFTDTCREFPIVFVKAGPDDDGSDAIAPIAVLGLTQGQNLYLSGDRWRANYMPALLRLYPFCIARMDAQRFAICIDMAFSGTSVIDGQPLFTEAGEPAELLKSAREQLEVLEGEVQRTRNFGRRLRELGLLQEMRFDVTLPDGAKHTVDGFMTIDDKKATDLPEPVVAELHRSGYLALMHAHWISMGNMRRLVDWHVERGAAAPAAPAANAPSA